MDTETVVQALPHIVLYFKTSESADEEWNKHYCEALLEAQKRLAMDDVKPIFYKDCADAMMKMWMECVLTDGEYNRIMDKLNKAHKEGKI